MSTHIGLLKEWWESAEIAPADNPVRTGDVIIAKFSEDDFRIVNDSHKLTGNSPFEYRVLERAEQFPDWADSVAVIASYSAGYGKGTVREVFVQTGFGTGWFSPTYEATEEELSDCVPLIEKKVTEDMVERGAIILYGQKTSPDFGSYEHRWNEASLVQKMGHRDMARAILEGSL